MGGMRHSKASLQVVNWYLSHGVLDGQDETVSASLCPIILLWLHKSISYNRDAIVAEKMASGCLATLALFKKTVVTEARCIHKSGSHSLTEILSKFVANEKFSLDSRRNAI